MNSTVNADSPSMVLLGPQRRPGLDKVVAALGLDGPFATITAGWQERESADDELTQHLGGAAVNLRLWERRQDVLDRDPEFAAAWRHRRAVIDEMQELYLLGVGHTVAALDDIRAQGEASDRVRDLAIRDAEEVLRSLDRRHLERVREVHADFYAAVRPHERDLIAGHRAEVAQILGQAQAVVIAGGHVAELLDSQHLFNVVPAGLDRLPIIAWSAGAMALTERVVLFNDNASRGPRSPEIYDDGLGLLRETVVFPSAHQRLHMHDLPRMATMTRRFAPAWCVPLDPGTRVTVDAGGRLEAGTTVIGPAGSVATLGRGDDEGDRDG
ncbi:type 1 glutamine amidotransferase-like domain-containing protein [Flexivirga sp. ID2601S]|uniref:Type 1 glutamine amidotransferase-like domain-containing protein n=1 Tax=Flexivirga aerilata TaxID=1656889 RepID=A0A849AFP8_9MICO|nr:type 1 glutamine amidotransferase-like domain-containing protein [Flexivirga aerilata]